MFSTRQNKVSRLIQKEVGNIFQKEAIDLPKNALITVTTVRISGDLKIAHIYLSIFPSNKSREVMDQLEMINKQIRFILGNHMKNQLKDIPELHFHIDDSLDYIENIERLIND